MALTNSSARSGSVGDPGPRPMARDSRGQLAHLGLDGDPVPVREPGQAGDAFLIVFEVGLRVGGHDEVEAARHGLADPVVGAGTR